MKAFFHVLPFSLQLLKNYHIYFDIDEIAYENIAGQKIMKSCLEEIVWPFFLEIVKKMFSVLKVSVNTNSSVKL